MVSSTTLDILQHILGLLLACDQAYELQMSV